MLAWVGLGHGGSGRWDEGGGRGASGLHGVSRGSGMVEEAGRAASPLAARMTTAWRGEWGRQRGRGWAGAHGRYLGGCGWEEERRHRW